MRVTVRKRSTSDSVRLPRSSSRPADRLATMKVNSTSELKQASKSTSRSTIETSESIENSELPSNGLWRSEGENTAPRLRARDQKLQSPSAPPDMYTSELQTPIDDPRIRSGVMPSSSRRFRHPAW